MRFWLKMSFLSYLSNGEVHNLRLLVNFSTYAGCKLGGIDSAEENSHDGYNVQQPGMQQTAFGAWQREHWESWEPRAQSGGQTKIASINSRDFAWNCHSLFQIIHCDFQLKCFKLRRAQLLSEVNRITRLTRCKQPPKWFCDRLYKLFAQMKTAYCGSTAHSQNDRVYALVGTTSVSLKPAVVYARTHYNVLQVDYL